MRARLAESHRVPAPPPVPAASGQEVTVVEPQQPLTGEQLRDGFYNLETLTDCIYAQALRAAGLVGNESVPENRTPKPAFQKNGKNGNIFFGAMPSTGQQAMFQLLGVSAAVNLTKDEAVAGYGRFCEVADVKRAEMHDKPRYLLYDRLQAVLAFLDAQEEKGKVTFVHCYAGVNRAAACVVAYAIRKKVREEQLEWSFRKPGALVDIIADLMEARKEALLTNASFRLQLVLWMQNNFDFEKAKKDPLLKVAMFKFAAREIADEVLKDIIQEKKRTLFDLSEGDDDTVNVEELVNVRKLVATVLNHEAQGKLFEDSISSPFDLGPNNIKETFIRRLYWMMIQKMAKKKVQKGVWIVELCSTRHEYWKKASEAQSQALKGKKGPSGH
eukprot:gnl/TRDRNA2_/TRDRNA2_137249_c4_seq1.p1 gnl/TRDRNA2_/TRDRNA2_137249_c4~~gnl/TRDRNA2_/TRDRNA2_137249_c4_seq1.p1  ORF type:complete len:386 (+),score=94.99 gnl/TRDRNA2_/TRDRNA2_137249_c4_seq1:293-1450(+)